MEQTAFPGRPPIKRKSSFYRGIKKEGALGIVSYLFMLLFIYAGIRKVIDYNMYSTEIEKFPLLVNNSTFPLIHKIGGKIFWLIVVMELCAAFLLVKPKWRLKGLYLASVNMIVILCYLLSVLQFSKEIPIFFGSIFPNVSLYGHIVLNMVLLFISVTGILAYSKPIFNKK